MENPVLYIVIPCYNEQEVLPITAPMFLNTYQQSHYLCYCHFSS